MGERKSLQTAEEILEAEREKAQKTVKELLRGEDQILSVLTYQNLYHNLKAAIKGAVNSGFHGSVYYDDCAVDGKEMERIVAEKDFDALPEHMREAAREACETFLHTGDGQACDVIVDRAALEAIYSEGKKSKEPVIMAYAESVTAGSRHQDCRPLPENGEGAGIYAPGYGSLRQSGRGEAGHGGPVRRSCYL